MPTTPPAGVPIIADKHFLETYTMYDHTTTVALGPGETDADAMSRLLAGSGDELRAKRQALIARRLHLNEEAVQKVKAMLEPFFPDIHAAFFHESRDMSESSEVQGAGGEGGAEAEALKRTLLGRKGRRRGEEEGGSNLWQTVRGLFNGGSKGQE